MPHKLKITQIKSASKRRYDQAQTLRALGIKRMQHSVVQTDTPQIRGMIHKLVHLLKVEEIQA